MELRFRLLGAAIAGGLAASVTAIGPSSALDSRFLASLRQLDPNTRLEQICDKEAMSRIARDNRKFKPDRAKSYVTVPPQHIGDTLRARGAAFRSKGRWYKLSFVCRGSADHMEVVSFDYKIGDLIPARRWADYNLWR